MSKSWSRRYRGARVGLPDLGSRPAQAPLAAPQEVTDKEVLLAACRARYGNLRGTEVYRELLARVGKTALDATP